MQIRTRIAGLSFSDKRPVREEPVLVAGYIQWYDSRKKMWMPLEGEKVNVFIDNEVVGDVTANHNGYFVFEYVPSTLGEHLLEVKFEGTEEYEESKVIRTIKIIPESQRRRVLKLTNIMVIGGILIILLIFLLALWFSGRI